MAMGIVPVAMSLEVAYSVLPSMIYDKKREGGISDFTICPLALFHIFQKEFGAIGLTWQEHTSGLELQYICMPLANNHLKEMGKWKNDVNNINNGVLVFIA